MILSRRKFLIGASALVAAPAIVHASNLMPVKALRLDDPYQLLGAKDINGPWFPIRGTALEPGYLSVAYPAKSVAMRGIDPAGFAFIRREEALHGLRLA